MKRKIRAFSASPIGVATVIPGEPNKRRVVVSLDIHMADLDDPMGRESRLQFRGGKTSDGFHMRPGTSQEFIFDREISPNPGDDLILTMPGIVKHPYCGIVVYEEYDIEVGPTIERHKVYCVCMRHVNQDDGKVTTRWTRPVRGSDIGGNSTLGDAIRDILMVDLTEIELPDHPTHPYDATIHEVGPELAKRTFPDRRSLFNREVP